MNNTVLNIDLNKPQYERGDLLQSRDQKVWILGQNSRTLDWYAIRLVDGYTVGGYDTPEGLAKCCELAWAASCVQFTIS